jgi:glycosyltransferase involved in cell wall biosynthesis
MTAVIREAGVDVIHAVSYPASLYAAVAAARTATPQIWHEHNIKRLHPVNKFIYRRVADTCRWVIGPSDAVTHNLGRAGIDASKLRTVYNGIDLSRFQGEQTDRVTAIRQTLGVTGSERAVGLFGQMLPYNGHRTLIAAAPRVLQAHPGTRFYLVGALENPPYEQALQALIASHGLSGCFTFTGWRQDVQDIVGAMDVVVVATTTPEPAALMLMEAMAMKRPVVGSNTGGTPEIIVHGETGLLFTPGDSAQLAEAIGQILMSPDLARRLGTAGRARVERDFDQQRHVETMLELYARAASTQGHGR